MLDVYSDPLAWWRRMWREEYEEQARKAEQQQLAAAASEDGEPDAAAAAEEFLELRSLKVRAPTPTNASTNGRCSMVHLMVLGGV